jgi:methyl-accepting chemotaxis protein
LGGGAAWGLGRWVAAAVLVAVSAAAAYVASGHVTVPLRNTATGAPITYYVGDELEELTASCRRFFDEARAFDEKTRRVAEELTTGAGRARESLTEQASIAAEQASAISQTSVTMKELAGTVKQTAARAEEISGRVDSSAGLIKTARDQILANTERIEALTEEAQTAAKLAVTLNEGARRMDEIVALVNDLAEQSTVLALNAAIEAAKAGEFGRGFAAVAREVKNLAGSSKEGTEEIRKVLHHIRDGTVRTVASARGSAEQSSILREGAAKTKSLVEEIVPLVDEMGRTSKQIAASARQQSLGLEQVTTAVENINEAAAEALGQVNAVRDAVDNMARISSRLAEEADASRQWKGR